MIWLARTWLGVRGEGLGLGLGLGLGSGLGLGLGLGHLDVDDVPRLYLHVLHARDEGAWSRLGLGLGG